MRERGVNEGEEVRGKKKEKRGEEGKGKEIFFLLETQDFLSCIFSPSPPTSKRRIALSLA